MKRSKIPTYSGGVWADRVLAVRKKLGLTQEQLAQRLDVSFATINRWENAHCRHVRRVPMKAVRALEEELAKQKPARPSSSKRPGRKRNREEEDVATLRALNKKFDELLVSIAELKRGLERVNRELRI